MLFVKFIIKKSIFLRFRHRRGSVTHFLEGEGFVFVQISFK